MKCVSMELSWNLAAVELQSYEPQGYELTGQPNGLIELLIQYESLQKYNKRKWAEFQS